MPGFIYGFDSFFTANSSFQRSETIFREDFETRSHRMPDDLTGFQDVSLLFPIVSSIVSDFPLGGPGPDAVCVPSASGPAGLATEHGRGWYRRHWKLLQHVSCPGTSGDRGGSRVHMELAVRLQEDITDITIGLPSGYVKICQKTWPFRVETSDFL